MISRAIFEDDLGEYEVFYSQGGVKRLERSFAAGAHSGNLEAVLTTHDAEAMRDAAARGIHEIESAVSLVQIILSIRAVHAPTLGDDLAWAARERYRGALSSCRRSAQHRVAEGTRGDAWMLLDQQRIR